MLIPDNSRQISAKAAIPSRLNPLKLGTSRTAESLSYYEHPWIYAGRKMKGKCHRACVAITGSLLLQRLCSLCQHPCTQDWLYACSLAATACILLFSKRCFRVCSLLVCLSASYLHELKWNAQVAYAILTDYTKWMD